MRALWRTSSQQKRRTGYFYLNRTLQTFAFGHVSFLTSIRRISPRLQCSREFTVISQPRFLLAKACSQILSYRQEAILFASFSTFFRPATPFFFCGFSFVSFSGFFVVFLREFFSGYSCLTR